MYLSTWNGFPLELRLFSKTLRSFLTFKEIVVFGGILLVETPIESVPVINAEKYIQKYSQNQ